jgi:hypothetical protein
MVLGDGEPLRGVAGEVARDPEQSDGRKNGRDSSIFDCGRGRHRRRSSGRRGTGGGARNWNLAAYGRGRQAHARDRGHIEGQASSYACARSRTPQVALASGSGCTTEPYHKS